MIPVINAKNDARARETSAASRLPTLDDILQPSSVCFIDVKNSRFSLRHESLGSAPGRYVRARYKRSQQIAYPGPHPACFVEEQFPKRVAGGAYSNVDLRLGALPRWHSVAPLPHMLHMLHFRRLMWYIVTGVRSQHTGHVSSPQCHISRVWMRGWTRLRVAVHSTSTSADVSTTFRRTLWSPAAGDAK